jgi:hypothetical protein
MQADVQSTLNWRSRRLSSQIAPAVEHAKHEYHAVQFVQLVGNRDPTSVGQRPQPMPYIAPMAPTLGNERKRLARIHHPVHEASSGLGAPRISDTIVNPPEVVDGLRREPD